MNFSEVFLLLLVVLLLFLIDTIWIVFLAGAAYRDQIALIQGSPMQTRNWIIPLIYLSLGLGVLLFSVPRVESDGDQNKFLNSMIWGGLLGFIIYSVFDLTNYVIFNDWDLGLGIKDILWGTFLTGFVTYLTTLIKANL